MNPPASHGPVLEPEIWTTQGFLQHFMRIHDVMGDRAFAFVLGSGASRPSGIPTGGELVERWLDELRTRLDTAPDAAPMSRWATSETLAIKDFRYAEAAEFYSAVYLRRFGKDPDEGYAYLERVMEAKEPSLGYSILARILESTPHRVVITTNFDNLVADALSIYTRTYPLMCGHESLTGFVRPRMRRPLIAKIHRDLLFAPQSGPEEIASLAPGWSRTLRTLFQHYTPVVIGYGGNDGTLMGLLEELEQKDIVGGIYWCYRKADGLPSERIRRVVGKHGGVLVPILGFDELMVQLGESLKVPLLAEDIEQRARERVQRYRNQVKAVQTALLAPAPDPVVEQDRKDVREALTATLERENDWWLWEFRAREERNMSKRDAIYEAGLMEFPESPELLSYYAHHLWFSRGELERAESLYQRAMELDGPGSLGIRQYYAQFLVASGRPAEAERLLRALLIEDKSNPETLMLLVDVLVAQRQLGPETESLFQRAVQQDGTIIPLAFAAFPLLTGRLDQARELAIRGYQTSVVDASRPWLAWVGGIISCIQGLDDSEPLRALKSMLAEDFDRFPHAGSLNLLDDVADRLGPEEMKLYSVLSKVIRGSTTPEELEKIPRWSAIVVEDARSTSPRRPPDLHPQPYRRVRRKRRG